MGTLQGTDQVVLASGEQSLETVAQPLQDEHHHALKTGSQPIFWKRSLSSKGVKETYYSYGKTHRILNFGKQRLVINHRQADLSDSARFFISNKLNWQATGITRIRRHRWSVEV